MFLVLFGTFPIYPGDCHDQCAHWSRNDRILEVSATNTNLSPPKDTGCHWFSISPALFSVVSVIFSPPMILASSRLRPSKSRGVTVV